MQGRARPSRQTSLERMIIVYRQQTDARRSGYGLLRALASVGGQSVTATAHDEQPTTTAHDEQPTTTAHDDGPQ